MAELLFRIGRFASRRRFVVMGTWLAILVITVGAFLSSGSAPAGEITIPGTETATVTDRLAATFPDASGGSGTVVVHTVDGTPFTAAQKAAVGSLVAQAARVDGVRQVIDPFTTQAEREDQAAQIADGRTQLADAQAALVDGQAQLDEGARKLVDGQAEIDANTSKLEDGQAQLDAAKSKLPAAQAKIDAGRDKLAKGQRELDAALTQLANGQRKLNAGKAEIATNQKKLAAARKQLAAGQAQLDAAAAQLAEGQAQLDAGRHDLEAQQSQLDAARAQAVADGTIDVVGPQLDAAQAQLDAGMAQIVAQQSQLDAGKAEIAANQKDLDAGTAKTKAGQKQLDAGKATIAASQRQLDAGRARLAAGQRTLDAGLAKLVAGQKKLDAGAATIKDKQAEIDDGRLKLADGQADIDAGRATIRDKQAEIDAAPARLATETHKVDAGATLLDLSSGLRLVSDDSSAAVVAVMFDASQTAVPVATKDALMDAFQSTPVDGVEIDFSSSIASAMPEVFGSGEAVGLVVAAIVLFVMLGTLIGAGLPIITALLGVAIGVLGAMSLSSVVEMASVTPTLGVMLGLAVGIDYALFIINRHRRQLMDGYAVGESIALATGTSGTAVVFAGSTVVIALLALNVTGIPFLGLMGTVGAACVAIAVLIAVTLTPALLSLVGMRVLRGREAAIADRSGPTSAAPARPMATRAAVARALLAITMLGVVAVPAASMRLSLPVGNSEGAETTQHRAYDIVADKLGDGANGPLLVVADLPGSPTEADALDYQVKVATAIAGFDDVVAVAPIGTSDDRTVAAFQVVPAEGPTSVSTEQLVGALRAASPLDGGITLGVAGQATGNIDISQKLSDALPLYLALVVGLSLIIMVVVFRSLFVPLVATGGFVLSYFAALGGTVAIFQWGWFGSVFGVATPSPILNFLPTILVGVLFGLAMDYMLFLASGMREAYAHGAPARTAVVLGFRAGRSVVAAAAIIMVAVFGGFIFSDSAIIRPIGFALAFGVLVDAFIVRMLLMPALMHLAGDKAWWLPGWLDRLIPNVDVEGASLERRHPHVAADHLDLPPELVERPAIDGAPRPTTPAAAG
jgi:putative drug exporter of the RND superfamily